MTAELIEQVKTVTPEYAMEVAQAAAQQVPDSEFPRFRSWCYGDETKRRESESAKHAGQAELIHQLRESGRVDAPVAEAESPDGFTAWTSPGTDVTAMPLQGDRYAHEGRVWESLVDFNSWKPGAEGTWSAWSDITAVLFPPAEDAEPVEYADGQQYTAGQRVLFNGSVYECVIDHYAAPGWTPENAHANWQKQ